MWPPGGLPQFGLQGRIRGEYQAEIGRALCVWGDAGWGRLVRSGKYESNHFSNRLVAASVRLVQDWAPQPAPEWVTCIPSSRNPSLVPDFAKRLADDLGLPFREVLLRTEERSEQKKMANSTQQALNVDGSLGVVEEGVIQAPVLLVDDMVDSRWTFTVATRLLREQSGSEVWPFALAYTGNS